MNSLLTDPANHPANGQLSVQRIERVIEALQRSIQYQNGGDMAYVIADAIKGLEELLVSKEAAREPVTDEELDQMIWKLERDGGMTPKLLSLMRELREVRKAKGEPAYYVFSDDEGIEINTVDEFSCGRRGGRPLYAAPSAPAMPENWQQWIADAAEYLEGGLEVDGELEAEGSIEAKRLLSRHTSMLKHQSSNQASPDAASGDEIKQRASNEPVNQPYKLPERVTNALTLSLQAMEFMSDTLNNLDAVCEEDVEFVAPAFEAVRAVLAGNSPVTPDGWIPVSERMPDPKSEARVCVYTPAPHEDLRYRFVPASLFKTVCRYASHWYYMTAPAAPQEVG